MGEGLITGTCWRDERLMFLHVNIHPYGNVTKMYTDDMHTNAWVSMWYPHSLHMHKSMQYSSHDVSPQLRNINIEGLSCSDYLDEV